MEEVSRIVPELLKPTHSLIEELGDAVRSVEKWQLGFWSNGSGQIPGFFQNRMKLDDHRYESLKGETDKQTEVLERMNTFMIGQTAARKVRESLERRQREAEAEVEAKRAERRKFWLGILLKVGTPILGGILTLLGWGLHKAAPVIQILIDDYMRAHPYVSEQLKNRSSNEQDPRYADRQQSDLPLTYAR